MAARLKALLTTRNVLAFVPLWGRTSHLNASLKSLRTPPRLSPSTRLNYIKDCVDCFNQWSDFVKARGSCAQWIVATVQRYSR